MSENNEIILDAKFWKDSSDFYASYCDATTAPKWFGKNLDAFLDSLRGGICKITPEKIIVRNLTAKSKERLGENFWKSVEEICVEQDVELETHCD